MQWLGPAAASEVEVINPDNETVAGTVSPGSTIDVEKAMAAARTAFDTDARTNPRERSELFESEVLQNY